MIRLRPFLLACLLLVTVRVGVQATPTLAQTPPAASCCRCEKNGSPMCVRFTGINSCGDLSGSTIVSGIRTSNASLLEGFTCTPLTAAQCAIVSQGGQCAAPPISENALQASLQSLATANGAVGGATTPGGAAAAAPAGSGTVSGGAPLPAIVPTLSVPIPGVSFTPATPSGDGVDVPFLAQYISGVYKYLIGISVLVASIMVVFGGFKYVMGATISSVGDGKKIIQDAIGGLVVLLCSYLILYLVNPDLVNLRSIHLLTINSVGVQETGSFDELGAYNGEGGADPEDACNIPNGGYFAKMWQVCRGQDGPGLAPRDQLTRLKEIVDIWKRIGVDEGGGVYVRGGNKSCTPRSLGSDVGQGHWVFKELHKFATKTPPQINLNNIGLPAECVPAIQNYNEDGDEAAMAALPTQCFSPAWDAYNRAIVSRYRAAGLYCADCILNVRNIYECFGHWQQRVGYIAGRVCDEPGSNGSVFNLRAGATDAQVHEAVGRLRFGDGMVNGGHAWFYTGGAGLGYEIMEMGGTGYPIHSIGPNSSDAAKAHAGFSINGGVGGMAVYASAEAFVKQKVHSLQASSPHPCVTGFRLLNDVPEDAFTALPTLPFTPFVPHAVAAPTATPPSPECRESASASPTPGAGGGTVTCADEGAVKRCFFNYQPTNDTTWQPNESFVLIPTRLFAASHSGSVNAHLYVHLHGDQSSGSGLPPTATAYSARLLSVAQEYAAQDVNIIIAAPHNRGTSVTNYMNGFNLQTFGTAAAAAITQALNQNGGTATNLHLTDAVVGGHSAATCGYNPPRGSKILSQARGATVGGAHVVGVVAYDGCLGYPASSSRPASITLNDIASGGQSVLVVPEVTSGDGMGTGDERKTQRMTAFGFATDAGANHCEDYITSGDVRACYKRRDGGATIVIDEVQGKGHSDSVVCGLGYAFHMFFNRNNGQPLTGRVTCS